MEDSVQNLKSYVENGCDDVESSKEWVKIKEFNVLEANNGQKLIKDYINIIKSFRLNSKIESLKKEQKKLEQKGMIEESIKLAIELKNLNDEFKKVRRG